MADLPKRLVELAGTDADLRRLAAEGRTQLIALLTPTPIAPPPDGTTGRRSQPPRPPAHEDQQSKVCPSMLASVPSQHVESEPA